MIPNANTTIEPSAPNRYTAKINLQLYSLKRTCAITAVSELPHIEAADAHWRLHLEIAASCFSRMRLGSGIALLRVVFSAYRKL